MSTLRAHPISLFAPASTCPHIAYAHMPTKNPYSHFCFALNIEMSAEELIEALKGYLADLEQGICKEVLCIEKKMVRKEYWEKGGQLLHNLQAMMGRLGQEKIINAILKVQNGANYETFIACVDNCYEEVARLLGEIRQNVMKMPRHLYGQFYKHMKSEFDADSVLMAYDEWEMNVGRLSYERLKEKRTLIVAEFLKKNVLRFVSHPTNRELELVDIEGIKTFLPSNYAMADDFKEQCAKFRRFISWQDDRLVLDYDAYGKYLFQHYYMLKEEERAALLALDKWLQLIQQDMEKVKPEEQEAATSESVETEKGDDDTLLVQLLPMFYGSEENTLLFLNSIQGMKGKQITDIVNKLIVEKKLSELSCHRELYTVLHNAGIYDKSESNWNMQVK